MNILEIKNLTKIYDGKVRALDDVSLYIRRGEVFGLLGVNGAGKTTLSSIIATLHPPTSGEVFFEGQSIYDDLITYRENLGFCPQSQNLDPFLNVRDNLIFAGRYFLMPKEKIEKRVAELMKRFEIEKYADFDVEDLSGGNKQRLLIARAMMHEPKLLILDEPTVGLDPDIRRKLWDLILELKQMGITIILTTHYLDEAEALSDHVCILHEGKVILCEQLQELKARHEQAKLEDIFLRFMKEADDNDF